MATERFDPYVTLGVRRGASLLEIARARRRLAKRHHPDVDHGSGAVAQMQAINAAWELLADRDARAAWDASHEQPSAAFGDVPAAHRWVEWPAQPAYPRAAAQPASGRAGLMVLMVVIVIMGALLVSALVAASARGYDPGTMRDAPGLQNNLDRP